MKRNKYSHDIHATLGRRRRHNRSLHIHTNTVKLHNLERNIKSPVMDVWKAGCCWHTIYPPITNNSRKYIVHTKMRISPAKIKQKTPAYKVVGITIRISLDNLNGEYFFAITRRSQTRMNVISTNVHETQGINS